MDLGTRLVMHGLVPVFAIMARIIQPKARIVGDSLYDFIASLVMKTHSVMIRNFASSSTNISSTFFEKADSL